MVNGPERSLRERAEEEWQGVMRRAAAVSSVLEEQQSGIGPAWKAVFEETWKTAWVEAWKAAWGVTWEDAWREAVTKGVEVGVDMALGSSPTDESGRLVALKSYQEVKETIYAESTYLGSLGEMHSMCQELNHLHAALQHSTSTSHEHVMQIRVQNSKKDWRVVSHAELQEMIESESRSRFQDHQAGHDIFIRGIAKVWELASKIWLGGEIKGPTEDWSLV
ncbi:hypothetical protein FRC10_004217 [Ceratobasidium sp. 414]|nr:hypothetical protein FRC10_004217 [Ceratobasidium sp. 414]